MTPLMSPCLKVFKPPSDCHLTDKTSTNYLKTILNISKTLQQQICVVQVNIILRTSMKFMHV